MKKPVARSDLRSLFGGAYYGPLRKLLGSGAAPFCT